MDRAPLPDLDLLDREALLALIVAHQEELLSHEAELRSLQAELESHRQTLSQQDEQLRSNGEQIEHLKLLIEKLKRCGGQLRQFGEDVSEQLEYIPDSFKVIRHVRPKFACNGCDRVVEAPAPSRPIERGLAR